MATRPAAAESGRVVHLPLRAPRLPTGVGPSLEPKAPQVAEPRRANSFAQAARYRKVQALVGAIDRLAVERGVDPLARPADVAAGLRTLSLLGWCEVSDRAGVREPSLTTQREVISEYERRASLVPPALVTRYVVRYQDADTLRRVHDLSEHETREAAAAAAEARRARRVTAGNGYRETVWVEERRVRA